MGALRGQRVEEIGKCGQRVQTSGYKKKNKISWDLGIWGSNIEHGDNS